MYRKSWAISQFLVLQFYAPTPSLSQLKVFVFIFGGATKTSWHFSNHLVENAPNESHDVRKARTNDITRATVDINCT